MPIPPHLGLCPNCRTRVSLEAKFCPVCTKPFLLSEAKRLAEEENAQEEHFKVSQQNQDSK